jgi:hypothetical protein
MTSWSLLGPSPRSLTDSGERATPGVAPLKAAAVDRKKELQVEGGIPTLYCPQLRGLVPPALRRQPTVH